MNLETVAVFHRNLSVSGADADLAGGEGRSPLLILHGLLGSSRNWQTVGRELAQPAIHALAQSAERELGDASGVGAAVFALDARNHGQSPHIDSMSHASMAEDVRAWLDAQGISGPVDLLGHSMGGRTGMAFACRYPERVRRLIVVDTAPRAYEWVGGRPEFAAMNALNLGALSSRAEAEQLMEPIVPDWGMRKFLTTNLERAESGQWRWSINLAGITAALPALEASPLGAGDRFEGEAHFIVCGRSPYVREEDHALIRAHFPAAQITVLPEAGHNPHMEAREEFVRTVLRIIA